MDEGIMLIFVPEKNRPLLLAKAVIVDKYWNVYAYSCLCVVAYNQGHRPVGV